MSTMRKLNSVKDGEYITTVMWAEHICDQSINRCREMAPIKAKGGKVTIDLDDDGEQTVILDGGRNKTARIYIDMALEAAVHEQTVNYVRNSTRCCYGKYETSTPTHCAVHTQAWFEDQVANTCRAIRATQMVEPDRAAIAHDHAKRVELEPRQERRAKPSGPAQRMVVALGTSRSADVTSVIWSRSVPAQGERIGSS